MIPKGYISLWKAKLICVTQPDIEGRIDAEISTGGLKAYYYHDDEKLHLTPAQWKALDKRYVFLFGKAPLGNNKAETDIIVEERAFRELFTDSETVEFKSDHGRPAKSKKNAGSKPQYEWDKVWIEILAYAHENGYPSVQADFVKAVAAECAKNLGERNCPDESTLKPKISLLYKRLEL